MTSECDGPGSALVLIFTFEDRREFLDVLVPHIRRVADDDVEHRF